jgi:hypothetical protein
MRPLYTVVLDNVAIGEPVQDVFALLAPNALGIAIERICLTAAGVAVPAQVRLRLKRGTALVTLGSGGVVATPAQAADLVPVPAKAIVHTNDTGQAVVANGGAFTPLGAWQWNVLAPFDYRTGQGARDACAPGEALILDLPAPLGAVYTVSGFIRWREVPVLVPVFSGEVEV